MRFLLCPGTGDDRLALRAALGHSFITQSHIFFLELFGHDTLPESRAHHIRFVGRALQPTVRFYGRGGSPEYEECHESGEMFSDERVDALLREAGEMAARGGDAADSGPGAATA